MKAPKKFYLRDLASTQSALDAYLTPMEYT